MKTRLVIAVLGFAISSALPIFAQDQNMVDPEVRQQIETAYVKFHEAINKNDLATLVNLFTPDAVEVFQGFSEGGVACGQQAIKKRYEIDLASNDSVEGKIVQMYAMGNDVCAITEYRSLRHHTGQGLTIYVRDGDEWKIRMHYVN
jgi:ketosteroid isomerase-like protein